VGLETAPHPAEGFAKVLLREMGIEEDPFAGLEGEAYWDAFSAWMDSEAERQGFRLEAPRGLHHGGRKETIHGPQATHAGISMSLPNRPKT
jgi:hypothetical protein